MPLLRSNPDSEAVQVLSSADLKKKAANDKYWNDKRISDTVTIVLKWGIYAVGVVALLSVGYVIYYYQFSDNRNSDTLLDYATKILIYAAGVITPAIQKVIGVKGNE